MNFHTPKLKAHRLEDTKVVLFEKIHDSAFTIFENAGITKIHRYDFTPSAEDLPDYIADAHILGIRSRTKLDKAALTAATSLLCVGCFCIGTNQVDLQTAKLRGVPVFNAPYSNTRSVAELVLGEIIMLLRQVPQKNDATHHGLWQKTVGTAQEVRGKILGIVGYGHIGSQLSVLAETVGMKVRYFDIAEKLAIGNATPCGSLNLLLAVSDVVSLHVPSTPQTRNMIGRHEINLMKPGAILINAARGEVVDVQALAEAIESGHLAGAGMDVFPIEPAGPDEVFESPLRGMPNVLLTPHIGGSTLEAQANIGSEVADKTLRYIETGSTDGAVNFVELCLPPLNGSTRFLHIHRNIPGIISNINHVLTSATLNITAQYLRTDGDIGFAVTDAEGLSFDAERIGADLNGIDGTIHTRLLKQ